jgi:ABC-2 type transport system ATP-binding protein
MPSAPGSADTRPMNVIEVTNLVKRYGDRTAVDGVSFSVEEGEIFAILGPNGAGKTTTVESISGLRTPDSGSISVLGLDPRHDRDELRRVVGVQLQESELPDQIRVWEAIDLYASFYANPRDGEQLLTDLGLADSRKSKFGKLSGGQKQRLSVALALIGNPKIAILDELTTGLDPQARRDTWQLIEDVRDSGVTVILGVERGVLARLVRRHQADEPTAGRPGAGCAQRTRARGAAAHRPGRDEPWGCGPTVHLGGDRQVAPAAYLREAERQRPGRRCGNGLRARPAPDESGELSHQGPDRARVRSRRSNQDHLRQAGDQAGNHTL